MAGKVKRITESGEVNTTVQDSGLITKEGPFIGYRQFPDTNFPQNQLHLTQYDFIYGTTFEIEPGATEKKKDKKTIEIESEQTAPENNTYDEIDEIKALRTKEERLSPDIRSKEVPVKHDKEISQVELDPVDRSMEVEKNLSWFNEWYRKATRNPAEIAQDNLKEYGREGSYRRTVEWTNTGLVILAGQTAAPFIGAGGSLAGAGVATKLGGGGLATVLSAAIEGGISGVGEVLVYDAANRSMSLNLPNANADDYLIGGVGGAGAGILTKGLSSATSMIGNKISKIITKMRQLAKKQREAGYFISPLSPTMRSKYKKLVQDLHSALDDKISESMKTTAILVVRENNGRGKLRILVSHSTERLPKKVREMIEKRPDIYQEVFGVGKPSREEYWRHLAPLSERIKDSTGKGMQKLPKVPKEYNSHHAEVNGISFAESNSMKILEIFPSRCACPACSQIRKVLNYFITDPN